jgi:hypothetical protein
MKQLLKKIKQISMLLLVISFIGCENDDDIYPEVLADFTYEIADTGTVTFINTSVNSNNYFWTFGDETSSTEINPIKTYTSGEYTVTLKAINVAGASKTISYLIVISDAGAPVITLLGEPTINMTVGDDPFTDPGATATDEIDGDITANIVVAGDTVDESTAGTYIITYNVSDAAGNAATERTRTVIVAEVALTCQETLLALPIDFDCDGIDYESKRVDGGIDFSVVDNPQLNGANAVASKVGEIVNKGDNWENLNFKLDTPIDFTTNKSIKVKLYSTVSAPIKLKLETGGTAVENDQTHGGTGWEELTFTLATSESFSNIIIFIDGPGNTAGTFYIDDIEQVAGGVVTSGAYLYSTAGIVDIVTVWSDWGTGTVQDGAYDQDATYNPSIKLAGTGSWGTVLAFTEIPAGKMAEYGNLEFKIKSSDATVKVKVPEVEKEFTIADGTPLADGWVQMSIPLSTFGAAVVDAAKEFAIFGSGNATLFLTDVMLSGDGGDTTPPPSDCPAPPAGELLSNGDFEAGESCWQLFAGTSISSTVNNGGSKSAEIQGATGAAVGIKQERFAKGILLPNTSYTVSFDIMASGEFGIGGVFKAFTFSEGADGGDVSATQHILADGVASLATTWETKTYTFTTAANANQVEGGLSFYMEIVNSAVKLNVDNVVIKRAP